MRLRAELCDRAEAWRWSSAWRRESGDAEFRAMLSEWPTEMPKDWLRRLNRAERPRDLEALRRSANRGQPYGCEEWIERVTKRYGLESAFRPRGRPCKEPK